jgi:hypothetical protein
VAKKNKGRRNVNRLQTYEYFVIAIDVAQNIEQSVPLTIFLNFNLFLKINHFLSNVLLCVKCILLSVLTFIIHRTS